MMKHTSYILLATASLLMATACRSLSNKAPIDREALVNRHTVKVQAFDSLASLSVGNGEFAFTVDATGLQTFPALYEQGVPLGTQAQWGWHSFPNVNGYKPEETWKNYNYHGKEEPYAVQFNEKGRQQAAANYYRENPHRLHLGLIGLAITLPNGLEARPADLSDINQRLDLWNGRIESAFRVGETTVDVQTVCLPDEDRVSAKVTSTLFNTDQLAVRLQFPYPTGKHADHACDWTKPDRHQTTVLSLNPGQAWLKRQLDADTYYIGVTWEGDALLIQKGPHDFRLLPQGDQLAFSCHFQAEEPDLTTIAKTAPTEAASTATSETAATSNAIATPFEADKTTVSDWWQTFWKRGGAVDFSACTDERAQELERRVVLSQYLMAIQCAGTYPPQETGLTYNSWYGKYHLEMHWWHGVHFALWGRPDLLERSLGWYQTAMPQARAIAQRQGWQGVRWMKMTDPSATEAPSKVGSFLIWQQPHIIYMAELMYRANPDTAVLNRYKDLVFETAAFMADYVDYEDIEDRYVLKGAIPAQETLKASETVNPPFELSYWHYALSVAQAWRQRLGLPKNLEWEIILDKLSPLAHENGLYLAAETATDTYLDTRYTSDHMAVLGAVGILPASRLVRTDIMTNTLNWIWDNWNWGKTWGWDYPMTAMNAARLGQPDKAVGALLMDKRTNTYLVNGHNYQDGRLRLYLPGNGGLLTAVAMMCAGWDGSEGDAPGFPKDGTWNVKWEGLQPMP